MMDPPLINEASFSAVNPSSYTLSEIWPFPISNNGDSGGVIGGLGLRMDSFAGFGYVMANRDEESTVTEQSGSRGGGAGGRKRKQADSEDESSKLVSTSSGNDLNGLSSKRMKVAGSSEDNGVSKAEVGTSSGTGNKLTEESSKPSEPPKDYIHLRAKRGQATDSHSLAERARREKISERMKILQDLVPGCNKVIGKALVLDEIINYIQSLQRQVEFLSMKLEAVKSMMNPSIEGFPSRDGSLYNEGHGGKCTGESIEKRLFFLYNVGRRCQFRAQLGAPTYDAAGMLFGTQAPREYAQGSQHDWLHMQIGSIALKEQLDGVSLTN